MDDSREARPLLVDDHPMVREGLGSMLAGDGTEILGEASTGVEAIRLAAELVPDLVLLDVELPDVDGLTVLSRLRRLRPPAAVLVVSMHGDPALVQRAVELGAAGYVLKGIGRRELRALVGARASRPDAEPRLREPLTAVERDVMRLLADGLTNRDIAVRLRDHRTWLYFARRYGLDVVGYCEPRPGIEPSPADIRRLATPLAQAVAREVEPAMGQRVAVLDLPVHVGGLREAREYFAFIDVVIARLVAALR